MTVPLSDDEAVAIAASSGHRWPTMLPTVAVDEPREYAAALARGARSLRLRGLLGGEPGDPVVAPELAAVGRAAATAQPVIVAVATPEGEDAAGGLLVACGLGDGEVMVDLVSPGGVHDITTASQTVATNLVVDYLRDVFDSGLAGDLEVRGQLGGQRVRVAKGAVTFDGLPTTREWVAAALSIHQALTGAFAAAPGADPGV